MFLCPSRHGAVWRGCPAAPRADRPAQDEHKSGSGKQGQLPWLSPRAVWSGAYTWDATLSLGIQLVDQHGPFLIFPLSPTVPQPSISVLQPGKKSLMLRMLLSPGGVSQPLTTSLARQRIIGEERERAVQAYRALKKRQGAQSPQPPCSPHLASRKKAEMHL